MSATLPSCSTARARLLAARLGERLLRETPKPPDRSLAGTAGLALSYRALFQATADARYRDAAFATMRRAATCTDVPSIGLFTGISGLRGVAAMYAPQEAACRKLVEQCDAYVEAQLPSPGSARVEGSGDYDVIAGWSGARLARCVDGPRESDRTLELLTWLLGDDSRWRCHHPLRLDEPPENDLGMAHGIAGVLATVALTAATFGPDLVALVAQRAGDLRAHAVVGNGVLAWPTSPQRPGLLSRPAWCYGAAGISAALYWCGRRIDDAPLTAFALDALETQAAQPVQAWGLRDHGLCHGTMGNALVYASVGRAAQSPALLDAATRAVDRAVDGIEGEGDACWANDAGMQRYDASGELDGAAGVALALVTLAGDSDSTWLRLHGLQPLDVPFG